MQELATRRKLLVLCTCEFFVENKPLVKLNQGPKWLISPILISEDFDDVISRAMCVPRLEYQESGKNNILLRTNER